MKGFMKKLLVFAVIFFASNLNLRAMDFSENYLYDLCHYSKELKLAKEVLKFSTPEGTSRDFESFCLKNNIFQFLEFKREIHFTLQVVGGFWGNVRPYMWDNSVHRICEFQDIIQVLSEVLSKILDIKKLNNEIQEVNIQLKENHLYEEIVEVLKKSNVKNESMIVTINKEIQSILTQKHYLNVVIDKMSLDDLENYLRMILESIFMNA